MSNAQIQLISLHRHQFLEPGNCDSPLLCGKCFGELDPQVIQSCSQNLNNKEEFCYDCNTLNISYSHFLQGLQVSTAPFQTETGQKGGIDTGLKIKSHSLHTGSKQKGKALLVKDYIYIFLDFNRTSRDTHMICCESKVRQLPLKVNIAEPAPGVRQTHITRAHCC